MRYLLRVNFIGDVINLVKLTFLEKPNSNEIHPLMIFKKSIRAKINVATKSSKNEVSLGRIFDNRLKYNDPWSN